MGLLGEPAERNGNRRKGGEDRRERENTAYKLGEISLHHFPTSMQIQWKPFNTFQTFPYGTHDISLKPINFNILSNTSYWDSESEQAIYEVLL